MKARVLLGRPAHLPLSLNLRFNFEKLKSTSEALE